MPKKPQFRFYYLDALRGFAAVGIVVFHFFSEKQNFFSGLYIAVDFFFVLSGFVLARAYTTGLSRNEVKKFVLARCLRLFPMPLCSILFVVLYQILLDIWHISHPVDVNYVIDIKPITVLLAFLMLQIFSQSAMLINFPLWSLSAEWIINFTMLGIPIHRKPQLLLIMTSLGVSGILIYEILDLNVIDFGFISNLGRALSGFSIGILARKYLEKDKKIKSLKLQLSLNVIGIMAFYIILVYVESRLIAIMSIPFGLLVFQVAKLEQLRPAPFLLRSPYSFLGRISFGVYVWHIPVHNILIPLFANLASKFGLHWSNLSISDFFLTLSLSILISVLFYRYIDVVLRRRFRLADL